MHGDHEAAGQAPPPAAADPPHATAVVLLPPVNCEVQGRDQPSQHQQANIAAGGIGDPQVIPYGVCGRNPNHVPLLAKMNMEVAQGIAHLNGFEPLEERRTDANQQLGAAKANGMSTCAIKDQIDCLENELDAILNAI